MLLCARLPNLGAASFPFHYSFVICLARACVQHFADYQCNSSMEIFKLLKDPRHAAAGGGFKKPADVGQAVCDAMQGMGLVGPIIAKLTVAPQVMHAPRTPEPPRQLPRGKQRPGGCMVRLHCRHFMDSCMR